MAGDEKLLKWARRNVLFEGHQFFRTSGSSGVEKWIALSDDALEWSARSVIEALEITANDVLGLALPEVHVGGYGVALRSRFSGARLERFGDRWSATGFTNWTGASGVTISSLVPTQVHDLVAGGFQAAKCLRMIVVGGGALDQELCDQARGLGWPVVPSYGMTETSSQVATGDGLPLLPGWEARIEGDRLALRGGGLLTSVIQREGSGFVSSDPKVDGWFVTNDRVELTPTGLKILGRADRVVKVFGELVDLVELESFWSEGLGTNVAIVARPDHRRGAVLHLFYEGETDWVESMNATLPGPTRLASSHQVEALPRSALGKVDRVALSKFHVD